MTDNNDGNAKAADANPANAANSDCNGCDHKKAAPESGSKRKTPLLPEPPKDSRNLGSTFHSDAASTTSTASSERQATKRPHSVTVTPSTSEGSSTITLTVAPFTGGPFSLKMRRTDSVEDLKKAVAKKLKVLKDRICLLYRER